MIKEEKRKEKELEWEKKLLGREKIILENKERECRRKRRRKGVMIM